MKKTLVTLSLLSAMATSMVAGTMALYQKTLNTASNVAVTAKTFVFEGAAEGTWATSVKLAPGESTQEYTFLVQNYSGNGSGSEVAIAVVPTIKFAIDSATANLYKTQSTHPDSNVYEELTAADFTTSFTMCDTVDGTYETVANFTLKQGQQSKKYIKVKVTWNYGDADDGDGDGISDDAEIQGMKLGDITFSIVGTQTTDVA